MSQHFVHLLPSPATRLGSQVSCPSPNTDEPKLQAKDLNFKSKLLELVTWIDQITGR